MASTDYDFISTRNEVIARALQTIGAHSLGQKLTGEQINGASDVLNSMVKSWQNQHVFLWTLISTTVTWVVDQSDYDLGSDPKFKAVWAAYRVENNSEYPIRIISHDEFTDIEGEQSGSGTPSVAAFDYSSSKIRFWPDPDSTDNCRVVGVRYNKDLDDADSLGDFTSRWEEALVCGLAAKLAPIYGLSVTEQRHYQGMASTEFYLAKAADRHRGDYEISEGAF